MPLAASPFPEGQEEQRSSLAPGIAAPARSCFASWLCGQVQVQVPRSWPPLPSLPPEKFIIEVRAG